MIQEKWSNQSCKGEFHCSATLPVEGKMLSTTFRVFSLFPYRCDFCLTYCVHATHETMVVPRFFQLSHNHIQAAVEDLQGGRLHSLLAICASTPACHPYSKKVLPDFYTELLVYPASSNLCNLLPQKTGADGISRIRKGLDKPIDNSSTKGSGQDWSKMNPPTYLPQ